MLTGWSIFRKKKFNPLKDESPSTIKILQLCATVRSDFHNHKYHDNTHCVTTVDGLIFDSNKEGPIQLSRSNLDSCCVGGDLYVLHHISKAYELVPSSKLKKNMTRKRKR